MNLRSVYTTFPSQAVAAEIGRQLVEERLAACINILGSCRSIYSWQGAIEDAAEVPAILKTTAAVAERLIARLAELHPYEVPAITLWPVEQALPAYVNWVEQITG
jgi:periplasmic divalent cation tolerance protein